MSTQLEVHLLGHVAISLDGRPLTGLSSRTAEALLIYLMCHDRPLPRQSLADFFWDERAPQRATTNLRTVLTMLRKVLGKFLIITRQTVAFNHDADYWLDVAEFERRWRTLEPALGAPSPLSAETAVQLRTTLDLYQGSFLEGFYLNESRGFEEWTLLTQERLRHQVESGLACQVAYYLENGDYDPGIKYGRQLLTLNPYSEDAQRQIMWLLARSGQHNAALQQYQSCRRFLMEELGVVPAPATTAAYERISSLTFPPPCRLPVQPTPFIGREIELAQLSQQLAAPGCRLLTILGPGGVGKTRLAVRAAEQLHQNRPGAFLHGIHYISLAPVSSPGLLATVIADGLNLPFEGTNEPQQQLLNYLRDKEMLLLLDNLEHLLYEDEGVLFIGRLLTQAPSVKLLITSRERLHLQEEWLFDLDGLSYPLSGTISETMNQDYDAAQLFVQNAVRVQRTFSPSAADWQAITRVCQLLEGMPLGLELASAWVRRHTCQEIAAQIVHDLDFLATSLRNVPARHRSLRAVFEHSWNLLTAPEQTAMRRLAVFRGRIDVTPAQEVAGVSEGMLATLVGKSFLRQASAGHGFELHELVRQYAAEKLAQEPAAEKQTWGDYGRYYAAFMAQWGGKLKGHGQQEALQAISDQIENIRAVWETAVAGRRRDELGRMLDGIHWFNWQRGYFQEGCETLSRAATALADEGQRDDLLLAQVQSRLAEFQTWLSEFGAARTLLEASIPILRQQEAWADLGWALDALGTITYYQGHYTAARGYHQEALDQFRRVDEQSGVAQSLNALAGVFCDELADYAAATPLYEESLAIYEALGDRFGQAKGIINLGSVAHSQGQYDRANTYYRQGIAICRELGHRQTLAIALNNLGQVVDALGDAAEATEFLQESIRLRRELGDLRGLALSLVSLGNLTGRLDQYEPARQHYSEALRIGLTLSSSALLADVLVGLADLLAKRDDVVRAAELLTIIAREQDEGQEIHNTALSILGRLEEGDAGRVATGRRQAVGKPLLTAVHESLRWLQV